MSDISRKALKLTRSVAKELLEGKIQAGPAGESRLDEVVEKLVSGEMIHSTPLSASEAKELVSRPLNNWLSLYAMILFIFLC